MIKKYFNYFYTYKRIADKYKISFLKRFAKEFNESYKKKEFDENLMDSGEMGILLRIMKDPEGFYYDDTIYCLNEEFYNKSNRYNYLLEEVKK